VRCLELCSRADVLVHCGDVWSLEAWETLASLGPPLVGVRGNMDEPALRELLPEQRVVEAGGARVGLVHIGGSAVGRAARLRAAFPGCDAVVYGHTHIPEVTLENGLWILNPGSPTERRRSPAHAMLLLEVEAGRIRPELIEL
jgi:putative phosphoesterase